MSAEVLREAARVIRERVESAPAETRTSGVTKGVWLNNAYHLTTTPAVALAVADWLDLMDDMLGAQLLFDHSAEVQAALAVAHAYLGGQS